MFSRNSKFQALRFFNDAGPVSERLFECEFFHAGTVHRQKNPHLRPTIVNLKSFNSPLKPGLM